MRGIELAKGLADWPLWMSGRRKCWQTYGLISNKSRMISHEVEYASISGRIRGNILYMIADGLSSDAQPQLPILWRYGTHETSIR